MIRAESRPRNLMLAAASGLELMSGLIAADHVGWRAPQPDSCCDGVMRHILWALGEPRRALVYGSRYASAAVVRLTVMSSSAVGCTCGIERPQLPRMS